MSDTGAEKDTGRGNALWQQYWRDRNTGFHQTTVTPSLISFWPSLELDKNERIFVPLCGKCLDLLWLARQGHPVVGVEHKVYVPTPKADLA